MAFAHSPKIVTDGLVLALDAGNPKSYPGSGTVWRDKSGNGLDATLTNGPTFSSDNGGIFTFDGSDDVCTSGNVLSDLVDLTLECWVKFGSQDSSYNGIISKTLNNTDGWELRTGSYTSTTTYVQFRYVGDNAATPFEILDNEVWYHIVGTGTSGAQKLYVDGVEVETSTSSATPSPNTNSLQIGALAYATHLILTGDMATAKIYNRAISTSEVQQNYNALKGRFGL